MGCVLSEGSGVLKVGTRPRRLEATLTTLATERSSPKDETDLSSSSFRRLRVEVAARKGNSSVLGILDTGSVLGILGTGAIFGTSGTGAMNELSICCLLACWVVSWTCWTYSSAASAGHPGVT